MASILTDIIQFDTENQRRKGVANDVFYNISKKFGNRKMPLEPQKDALNVHSTQIIIASITNQNRESIQDNIATISRYLRCM